MARMSGYKAISTKYIPATNTLPSRVKAYDHDGNSITISWDDDISTNERDCTHGNHANAAQALADKLQWSGELVGGATKDGYCFVFVDH
jgi:hypothetical protein